MGATVALWASAALTAYSIVEQQDASKRQASAESRRQQLLSESEAQKAELARKKEARELAIARAGEIRQRASMVARREGAGAGAVGGTAIGGEYALSSRAASNVGFFGQQVQIGENIFALGQQAGQAAQESIWAKEEGTTAAAWGAVSKDVFTTACGYKEVWASGKRIFS